MKEHGKRREWIKTAAIIFLSFLLVLTFFSGTIQNYYLPEVAVEYASSGTVSGGIRANGTVSAGRTYTVQIDETRTVHSVLVHNGDEVAAGDVLVQLEDKDSEELQAARQQLDALEDEYQRMLLNSTDSDVSSAALAVTNAEAALNNAVAARDSYRNALASTAEQKALNEAKRVRESLKKWWGAEYDAAIPGVDDEAAIAYYAGYIGIEQAALFKAQSRAFADMKYQDKYDEYLALLTEEGDDAENNKRIKEKLTAWHDGRDDYAYLEEAITWYAEKCGVAVADMFPAAGRGYADLLDEYKAYQPTIEAAANADVAHAERALTEAAATYDQAVTTAQQALDTARRALTDAQDAQKNDETLHQMDLANKLDEIARQRETVRELEANAVGAVITARQDGTVTDLAAVSGEKLDAGSAVCTILLADTDYTAELSLTAQQAARVQVGQSASVSGYYWGQPPRAVVTAMRSDPNTRGNRLVTLSLSGDVQAGSSYTFLLGETNASYDVVVPKSAVHEDNTGAFVLIVTNKSTPLGTRYHATRVDVTVLASDDTRCAVLGEFSGWDYVITSASAPIENGDQVRLASA